MAQDLEPEDMGEAQLDEAVEASNLDAIDAALNAQFDQDDRLGSGVPDGQGGDDLSFIQMSGLTRLEGEESDDGVGADAIEAVKDVGGDEDMDPNRPVIFETAGVVDVDPGAGPEGLEGADALGEAPLYMEPEVPQADEDEIDAVEAAADALAEELAAGGLDAVAPDSEVVPEADSVEEEITLESVEAAANALAEESTTSIDVPVESGLESETPLEEVESSVASEGEKSSLDALKELIADLEEGDASVVEQEAVESVEEDAESSASAPEEEDGAAEDEPIVEELVEEEEPVADEVGLVDDAMLSSLTEQAQDTPEVAEEPGDSVEEDWGVSIDEGDDEAVIVERESGGTPTALEEAEQLLQALEQQPREEVEEEEFTIPMPMPVEEVDLSLTTPSVDGEGMGAQRVTLNAAAAALNTDKVNDDIALAEAKPRRRSRNYARKRKRQLQRLVLAVLVLVLLGIGGVYGYQYLKAYMMKSEDLFVLAASQEAAGEYVEASENYLLFALRESQHYQRPEAQFRAASLLLEVDATSRDAQQDLLTTSLTLFEEFIADNPEDDRVERSKSMKAVLLYRLGRYEDAVEILQRDGRSVSDPIAELPKMRTLARCYAKLGEVAAAESAYLQAAVLPGNLNPEQDYRALGDLFSDLYRVQAGLNQDPVITGKYREMAVKYLTQATEVVGIDPIESNRIGEKLSLLERGAALNGVAQEPTELEAQENSSTPAEAEEAVAPVEDVGDWEVNPAEEAAALAPAATEAAEEVQNNDAQ